jgi:hypothetical protein
VSVSVPVRLPLAVGVKVRLNVQVLPAATAAPRVQVVPKVSTEKSPVTPIPRMPKDPVPVLVSVSTLGALVVFKFWFPNDRLGAEGDRTGIAKPAPSKYRTLGLLAPNR